jgi:hypothetical protein
MFVVVEESGDKRSTMPSQVVRRSPGKRSLDRALHM